jgi:hypothetical protein
LRGSTRALEGKIGDLHWDSEIVPHGSGKSAVEKRIGADVLIHVQLDTPEKKYSKGVLIQAKRLDRDERLAQKDLNELKDQCKRMLWITPDAFVFDYARSGVRCGAANKMKETTNRNLNEECDWTSYRFFLELFRCFIGDHKITSARVDKLPVPHKLRVRARGQFAD